MEQQGFSIRDRIKALNQSLSSQQSQISVPTLNTSISIAKERKIDVDNRTSKSEEDIYLSPTSNKRIQHGITKATYASSRHEEDGHPTEEDIYKVPSAKPVALSQINHESGRSDEGNYVTMYAYAPKNTAILKKNLDRSDIEDVNAKNKEECDDKTYASPSSRPVFNYGDLGRNTPIGDEISSDHYATPKNLSIGFAHRDRTLIPEHIGPRWQKSRQTVNDRGLRKMVDMFQLTTTTSQDTDCESVREDNAISKIPENLEVDWKTTSSHARYSTSTVASRNSSYKSNVSHESGNFSDGSETTSSISDVGRSRNISDVSFTYDEDDYISFDVVDDGISDPNEKVLLVLARGNEFCTERLCPDAQEISKQKSRERSESRTQEILKLESSENNTKTSNKFKSVVKKNNLAMATNSKISTSSSPNERLPTNFTTSRSLPASPAKFPSSPIIQPDSRTGQNIPNHLSSSHRHTSTSSVLGQRSEFRDQLVVSCHRPPSKASVFINDSLDDESENTYCEPSRITTSSQGKNRNQMHGSTRSLEINKTGDETDDLYVVPLSYEIRSCSLANLRVDDIPSHETRRKSDCDVHIQPSGAEDEDSVYLHCIGSGISRQSPIQNWTDRKQNFENSVSHEVRLGSKDVILKGGNGNRPRLPSIPTMSLPPPPPLLLTPPDEPLPPLPTLPLPDSSTIVNTIRGIENGKFSITAPHGGRGYSRSPLNSAKEVADPVDLATHPQVDSNSTKEEPFYYSVDDVQHSLKPLNDDDETISLTETQLTSRKPQGPYTRHEEKSGLKKIKLPLPVISKPNTSPPSPTECHSESTKCKSSPAMKLRSPIMPRESPETTAETANKPTVLAKPRLPHKPTGYMRASSLQDPDIEIVVESNQSPKLSKKSRSVKELSKMLSIGLSDARFAMREQPNVKTMERHLPSSRLHSEVVESSSNQDRRRPRHASDPAVHTISTTADRKSFLFSTSDGANQSETPNSVDISETPSSKQRPKLKRPSTAPPPRPNVPPPPPPSEAQRTQDIKKRKPPPSRPPPPSTTDIQAAAHRRRLLTLTENDDLKEKAEETINIYASIDEEPDIDKTRISAKQIAYRKDASKKQISKTNTKFNPILQAKNVKGT